MDGEGRDSGGRRCELRGVSRRASRIVAMGRHNLVC